MDRAENCVAKRTRNRCKKAEEQLQKLAKAFKEARDKRKRNAERNSRKRAGKMRDSEEGSDEGVSEEGEHKKTAAPSRYISISSSSDEDPESDDDLNQDDPEWVAEKDDDCNSDKAAGSVDAHAHEERVEFNEDEGSVRDEIRKRLRPRKASESEKKRSSGSDEGSDNGGTNESDDDDSYSDGGSGTDDDDSDSDYTERVSSRKSKKSIKK